MKRERERKREREERENNEIGLCAISCRRPYSVVVVLLATRGALKAVETSFLFYFRRRKKMNGGFGDADENAGRKT